MTSTSIASESESFSEYENININIKCEIKRKNLESEKFFSKFSYFLERKNFQNLKVMKIFIDLDIIEFSEP
jgi:hypothetical protein